MQTNKKQVEYKHRRVYDHDVTKCQERLTSEAKRGTPCQPRFRRKHVSAKNISCYGRRPPKIIRRKNNCYCDGGAKPVFLAA